MSNPKPLGAQTLPVSDSFQLLDSKFYAQPQGTIPALKVQLLFTLGGTMYAALSGEPLWLIGCLSLGGLTYFTLTQLFQWQTSTAQADQKIQEQGRALSSLTAINQALQDQLANQASLTEQLQQAEAAMLQSEKMATLGLLMAGVAHEINTPLGAIQASAENLDFSIEKTLQSLPQLCQRLDAAQLTAFAQLLDWAGQASGNRSSRQERQLKRELTAQLQALQISNAHGIAAILSPMGIEQDLEQILPILNSPDVDLILDAAYNLNAIQDNGHNIGIASNRANNIVASLRNYARKGSQAQPTLSDLRTGIDTVLMLYQNKLKHGVEVHRRYDDVPQLLCYPEELDQAWSNLIGNAIQAMEGKGQLDISLSQRGDKLMITIADSGPGISADVQAHIFTPYFTTKPMGEGSGLGLSITQKIIQRHHGSIELDSRPGKTSFHISLPLAMTDQPNSHTAVGPGLVKTANRSLTPAGPWDGSPPPNGNGNGSVESSNASSHSPAVASTILAAPPPPLQIPTVP